MPPNRPPLLLESPSAPPGTHTSVGTIRNWDDAVLFLRSLSRGKRPEARAWHKAPQGYVGMKDASVLSGVAIETCQKQLGKEWMRDLYQVQVVEVAAGRLYYPVANVLELLAAPRLDGQKGHRAAVTARRLDELARRSAEAAGEAAEPVAVGQ